MHDRRRDRQQRGVNMSVGIVGLGYVGLPLAVSFAEAGEHVIGIEVNARRVAQLRRGESYIEDVPDGRLQAVSSVFEPTTRIQAVMLEGKLVFGEVNQ